MPHHSRRFIAIAAVVAVIASSGARGRAQEDVTLTTVLDRLHAYLADYATRLPATIASEHYIQRAGTGTRAQAVTLDSDFGIVRLPGDREWLGFRDVLRADGKAVGDHAQRLDALFLHPSADRAHQAYLIAQESARHNIGPVTRTINNPALVLEILDSGNAYRMRFQKGGEDTVEKTKAWVIRFTETIRPTIVRSNNDTDAPSNGRAWVDPATGTLLRVEATISTPVNGVTSTTDVTFQRDPKLGFWVPARMNEEYLDSRFARLSSGEATYTNYRQFTVDTNETLTPNHP